MWVLAKLRDTVSLDWFTDKNEETGRFHRLHQNIITPDQIPEFCLPPRLCKSLSVPLVQPHPVQRCQNPNQEMATQKERLGLTGLYERPNTRRKESLFHARRPVYLFDRNLGPGPPHPRTALRAASTTRGAVAPQSGSISSLCESPSSSDSSPLTSTCTMRGATSCPALTQIAKRSPPDLSPPMLFPMDLLHCWDRLPAEHVLPLEGRGTIRFSIEHYHIPTAPLSPGCTIRLRVASVEEVSALSCALHVCLIPGRKQRQKSATIRQCRVTYRFNEDFFFTELGEDELQGLELRVKVVDKAGGAGLRRGALVGVFTKPLILLLPIDKHR
ncbi:C2 calcium-dependent domain-containing protein 4D [Eucyclogobius newberryi]|uniref:C2 calcium-dependent domain-containing protein 4D n=1 Tax=Eucyclogobius newberryi TaxID=166745 RepID=UPI003B5C67FF